MKMNFGAGIVTVAGWTNVDRQYYDGMDLVADVRDGFPKEWEGRFEMIVANHVLSDLTHHELVPALAELRRCLTQSGVLRILVPDLLEAVRAWTVTDLEWFPLGDDLPTRDERLCTFVTWFGESRSVFTAGYLDSLLAAAGFTLREMVGPGYSQFYPESAIVDLDDRERQALIMEASR